MKAYYHERNFFDDEDDHCAKKDGEKHKSILRQEYWCRFVCCHSHKIGYQKRKEVHQG